MFDHVQLLVIVHNHSIKDVVTTKLYAYTMWCMK